MVSFIDENREKHRVEPICKTLPIAPSTFYERKARDVDPDLEPDRTRRDKILKGEIQRIWDDNRKVYGAKKVWKELIKENRFLVTQCTIERLMRSMGLRGVIRGKSIRTTFPSPKDERPDDLVNREITTSSPNKLWVVDFTYVSTWQGFVYVAFIIDIFSRMIVGWRASRSMKTDFTFNVLNQVLWVSQVVERSNPS